MMLMFADPKEWWLELSPSAQAEAVRQSRQGSTPLSRQRLYLNAVCLQQVLAWLQADVPEAKSWLTPAACVAVWDVVTGMAVMVGDRRLILLPTEAIDDSELEVPQEWVDSPSWAGDYYLAVQVSPESGWIRVWGFTTHQELTAIGHYDADDRTYSVAAHQLTRDLNAFWATYQFCGTEQTRTAIAPLPELAPNQAESLIQRLGDPAIGFPRLAVPFGLWAALLAREDWRKALHDRRCGRRPVKLGDWLQGQFTAAWQAMDAMLSPPQVAWRSGESAVDESLPDYAMKRVKVLTVDPSSGAGDIALLVGMTPIGNKQINIGLHISPVGTNAIFLQDVQVRLLDEAGAEVGQARATATETIQFQFSGDVGEQFGVEVKMGHQTLVEWFEI